MKWHEIHQFGYLNQTDRVIPVCIHSNVIDSEKKLRMLWRMANREAIGKPLFQIFGIVISGGMNMAMEMNASIMGRVPFKNGIMEQDEFAILGFQFFIVLH